MGLAAFKRRAEAVKYEGETFERLDLRSMKAYGSTWKTCSFKDCQFNLTDFRGSTFEECVFYHCVMPMVNFAGCSLSRTNFRDCDLEQSSFASAHLTNVSFFDCRMAYGDEMFTNATARVKLTFDHCNLHGSSLDFREVDWGSLTFADCNCWGSKVSLGCAIFNGRVDDRMFRQLLALVNRVHPDGTVETLAGDQVAALERVMKEPK